MDYQQFVLAVKSAIPPTTVLSNPLRGTTRILKYSGDTLVYERGSSRFYAPLPTLHRALMSNMEGKLSTSDLRQFAPATFDSREGGHSCHCTMLLLIVVELGFAQEIEGRGVAGDPFFVSV